MTFLKTILTIAAGAILIVPGLSIAAPVDVLALYTFDDDTASDSSGNGNDGLIIDGVTFDSSFNGTRAASFAAVSGLSGINTGIDINPTALPALTMGAWVNAGAAGAGVGGKVLSHDNGGFDRTLGIDTRGSNAGTDYAAFTGGGVADIAGGINIGEWVHLAVTYDGTDINIYENGVLARSVTDASAADLSTFALFIGTNPGFNEDFIGLMDDVFVYGRALAETEIADIFNNGFDTSEVPLPAGFVLFATGLAGFGASRRTKQK